MDYCKYVNVFHGCGESDLPKPEGIAAKWFFLKAQSGNTSPAVCVPFGAMSVGPYSGGYPTGYGDNMPNYHSRPAHFDGGEGLLGFTHLQQSGTGAIGYYYNFVLVSPKTAMSEERRIPENEFAEPGFYSCFLGNIKCELTASAKVAYHRYTFEDEYGSVVIDLTNEGLKIPNEKADKISEITVFTENNCVKAVLKSKGIYLYVLISHNGTASIVNNQVIIDSFGKQALLQIQISLDSSVLEQDFIDEYKTFDDVKAESYNIWNGKLSGIKIRAKDEKLKNIFYSNLYHSYIKPVNRFGESFIYEKGKPFCTDFSTFWDMYKTAIPLIFLTDKEIGNDICETILSTVEMLGCLPNSLGINKNYTEHSFQARMLADYVLITAYRYGIITDVKRMINVIVNDVFASDKTDFTQTGTCLSATFVLDMAEACGLAADIADEYGLTEAYDLLKPFAEKWKDVFDISTGLLINKSEYYEGSLYNYSFRPMLNMAERIEIAGGDKKFIRLLDRFFGYGSDDTVQPSDPFDYKPVEIGLKLGRFEGFNNEPDTETPYSYIYAGRHDRTCEIIRSGMKYMFTDGRGGLPGNNDSGALSSYYVFAALGLLPVAGQNLFFIGSPSVDEAEIDLFNGKCLKITVKNNSDKNIYVKSVYFNDNEIKDFRITAEEIMQGGHIKFEMTGKPC